MVTQDIVIAVLQGLTLILPVGTTAHLALLSHFLDWPAPSAQLTLVIRVGVLLAVLAYFWSDLWDMGAGVVRAAKGKRDPGARLALQILVATIITLGLGAAGEIYLPPVWTSLTITGWAMIGFALLLLFFDRISMTVKRLEHAGFGDTIGISIMQVLALVPGVSRSGVTITMARFLGYERADAVRLSMLLYIPVLIAAIAVDAFHLEEEGGLSIAGADLLAALTSFIVALLALATLMGYLRRGSFMPLVIYRLIVGSVVVAVAHGVIAP